MNIKEERIIINELIKIGELQAKILAVDIEPIVLDEVVSEIVGKRMYLKCLSKGIITKEEFANVMLAHFQTSICFNGNVVNPKVLPDYSELSLKIIRLVSPYAIH